MALYSRVWRPVAGISSGGSCNSTGCPSECYNAVMPNTSAQHPSLLLDPPYPVATCVEAMEYWADQLRRRTGARACLVQSASNAAFNLTLKRPGKTDVAITVRTSIQCQYPVNVDYSVGTKSVTNRQFQAMANVLDWLIEEVA